MKTLIATAFNATWLVEFYENGFQMYTYDANEDDYIPSSIHNTGNMEWNFLNQLKRNGFTIMEA